MPKGSAACAGGHRRRSSTGPWCPGRKWAERSWSVSMATPGRVSLRLHCRSVVGDPEASPRLRRAGTPPPARPHWPWGSTTADRPTGRRGLYACRPRRFPSYTTSNQHWRQNAKSTLQPPMPEATPDRGTAHRFQSWNLACRSPTSWPGSHAFASESWQAPSTLQITALLRPLVDHESVWVDQKIILRPPLAGVVTAYGSSHSFQVEASTSTRSTSKIMMMPPGFRPGQRRQSHRAHGPLPGWIALTTRPPPKLAAGSYRSVTRPGRA